MRSSVKMWLILLLIIGYGLYSLLGGGGSGGAPASEKARQVRVIVIVAVAETASTIEQMATSIRRTADNVAEADSVAKTAAKEGFAGRQAVQEALVADLSRAPAFQQIVDGDQVGGSGGNERVDDARSFARIGHQPGMPQGDQVPRNGRLRKLENRSEVADADAAEPEEIQQA